MVLNANRRNPAHVVTSQMVEEAIAIEEADESSEPSLPL